MSESNRSLDVSVALATMPKHKLFYATLCLGDGGGYVTIEAADREAAREKMFNSKYGTRWAFLYDETERAEAIDAFGEREKDYLAA